jgi:hypothetical protein
MRLQSRDFAYITITETKLLREGMARGYHEFVPVAAHYGEQLPETLLRQSTQLDADFDYLTYGDQGQRGERISKPSPPRHTAFLLNKVRGHPPARPTSGPRARTPSPPAFPNRRS